MSGSVGDLRRGGDEWVSCTRYKAVMHAAIIDYIKTVLGGEQTVSLMMRH